ncbi:MAG: helix-turn-helix transcriptional regulator [Ruminococcaceae bacterium]|nr:helix-turn-helix transcriptional regulator [Oscillospiraceae bacterium]
MNLGDRIVALRKDRNISQGDLAKRLNVSRQAVSKWEQGLSSPDTVKLIQLAQILETEVEYLATGNKPEPSSVVLNVVETVERVEEKVVVKEVIRHVRRKPVKKNPIDYWLVGGLGFVLGILVGLIF